MSRENKKWEKLKWGGKAQGDVFEKDSCTSCGVATQYNKFDHVDIRKYYVEGAGQLCYDCYMRIYFKEHEGTLPPA